VNPKLVWFLLGLLLLAWWDGFLSNTSTFHVLELKCANNTGFDDDQRCLKFERPGAELEITVNTNTQKVLISVVKNDGGWIVKDFVLDQCSVVTAETWKCQIGSEGGSSEFRYLTEYGMIHGRYYKSLTGGIPPNFYTSSISGLAYRAWQYGLISLPNAMKFDGYSREQLVHLITND
jgi:hypothetical protein